MSVTTPSLPVPDTAVPHPSWIRTHLGWVLVTLALVAAVALLAVPLADAVIDDSDPRPATMFDADRGSISAIDHRTAVAGAASTDIPTLVEGGGVEAIERRAASAPGGSLRHESISAIDHRTATQGR